MIHNYKMILKGSYSLIQNQKDVFYNLIKGSGLNMKKD